MSDKKTIGAAIAMAVELSPDNTAEWDTVKIKNTILALRRMIREQDGMIERLEVHVEALEEIEHNLRTKHGAVERG